MATFNYVRGIPDLKKEFMAIRAEMKGKGAAILAQGAASLFAREARKNAPFVTGNLRGAIKTKRVSSKASVNAEYITFVQSGKQYKKHNAWYAHIVEYGGKGGEYKIPRKTDRRKKKAVSWDGGTRTYHSVMHPPSRARPFMRPAFDNNYSRAIDIAARRLRRTIERKGWAQGAIGDEVV